MADTDGFFQILDQRNLLPDGTPADPTLRRRLRHPICLACQEAYRAKFPGKPFRIVCEGIYSDVDYQEIADETGATLHDVKEVMDRVYWARNHYKASDENGDMQPFVARDYQVEQMSCTAERKIDRWSRGAGKALDIRTPIPGPSGWKTMEQLQPGDLVFGSDGLPCMVTFATEVMHGRECFEVEFSDGSVLVADGDHLWETWTKQSRRAVSTRWRRKRMPKYLRVPQAGPAVVTTREILHSLRTVSGPRGGHTDEINHSIPVCAPVRYGAKNLPLNPYVLGLWLGDGGKHGAELSTIDREILDGLTGLMGYSIRKRGKKGCSYWFGHRPRQRDANNQNYAANGSVCSLLREMGLLYNKHIPQAYLQSSLEQRLALLQGLMDSDGWASRTHGKAQFCNTNQLLAEQTYELVCSLGMKAGMSSKIPKLNGKPCARCYMVSFCPSLNVFRLPRKAERQVLTPKKLYYRTHRYIVAVRPVASVPVKCIQVDSANSLYLAGKSFIPTHNTTVAEIAEIHTALNRKNYPILVLCPAKHQAKKWFDELVAILEGDEELAETVVGKVQAPFYQIKLSNGSTISIFTAGSKSGRSADVVRTVSPRRIRLEEQDLLNEKDYGAVSPLLRRYKEVQFGGSSTPLGKRETFWEMCNRYPDYREFYVPVMRLPGWGPDLEEACRREARTEIRYIHEFLAEFGDQEAGVFKGVYVDLSRKAYSYAMQVYDSSLRYWLGVDWNGRGTGTRLRVVSYNPATLKRRVVDTQAIDSSHDASLDAIFAMSRKWHCEGVVTDAGYGGMENELLKKRALDSLDPDDRRLMNIQVIDFGASLRTNKLVPNRGRGLKIAPEELDRRTKPFMVEGAVMCLESGLLEFSSADTLLDEQLRAYHVKTWSQHGWANTYDSGNVGDHDLDALMLSLLGLELKYGLLYRPPPRPATASSLALLSGFGPACAVMDLSDKTGVGAKRALDKAAAGVPSRQLSPMQRLAASAARLASLHRGASFVTLNRAAPGLSRATSRPPSRTLPSRPVPGYSNASRDPRVPRRTPL